VDHDMYTLIKDWYCVALKITWPKMQRWDGGLESVRSLGKVWHPCFFGVCTNLISCRLCNWSLWIHMCQMSRIIIWCFMMKLNSASSIQRINPCGNICTRATHTKSKPKFMWVHSDNPPPPSFGFPNECTKHALGF
jgi:hypothetical protein